MKRIRTLVIVVLPFAIVGLVASLVGGWDAWVFLGVIVVTLFGAAVATVPRDYTTKKRTFVRTSKPPR